MKVSFSGIFWGLVCIGVGLFFLAGSWGSYAEYKRVRGYEGLTIGHITGKHFKLGSDEGGNYYIEYWFVPFAGGKVSASSVIAKQQWDMLRIDDTLEVRFDKSNPNRSIPMYGGGPSLVFSFFTLVLGGAFLLFGTPRFINGFRNSFQRK